MTDVSHQCEELCSSRWNGSVRLPSSNNCVSQDQEWCEVLEDGAWRRIRFHDYASIYARPGLYEHLFYESLECNSPRRVVRLLAEVQTEQGQRSEPLRAIDLGAGNGIVAEELRRVGATSVIGIDILPEARAAALRDRPNAYSEYFVADLCAPTLELDEKIRSERPNVLVCVAALGFGDIPPLAYHHAMSFVPNGGLLAFNIKDEFLEERYAHGFSELVRRMVRAKVIRVEATRRYCHRLSVAGAPIFYTAMIATKLGEIPQAMLVDP